MSTSKPDEVSLSDQDGIYSMEGFEILCISIMPPEDEEGAEECDRWADKMRRLKRERERRVR